MLATASNGEGLCNINLSRKSLLVLLYSPIISAICNVVDFMVGTSKFVGIEPAQGACQPVCLVGCLVHTLLEVVKKTLLAFGAVEETELIIDDGLCAAALDKLCLLHDAAVVLLLELLSRRSLDV